MREVGKRIRGLLMPYFVFGIGFMLLSYCIESWNGVSLMRILKDIGVDPRVTPLLAPLWYVRALFVLVLISPLVEFIVGRNNKKMSFLGILSIAVVCFIFRPYSDCASSSWYLFFNYGFSLEGLLYFSVGVYLAKHRSVLAIGFRPGVLLLVAGIALFALRAYLLLYTQCHWQACQIGFFAIPCLGVGLFSIMPLFKLPASLMNASFPVYVCHFYIIAVLGGRISRGGGGWFVPDASIVHWALRIIVAFGGSIVFAVLLGRFFPSASSFLFGGRSSANKS